MRTSSYDDNAAKSSSNLIEALKRTHTVEGVVDGSVVVDGRRIEPSDWDRMAMSWDGTADGLEDLGWEQAADAMRDDEPEIQIDRVEDQCALYEIDPYRRSTQTPSKVALYLDPEAEPARLYCGTYSPGQGVSFSEHHRRLLSWSIPALTAGEANALIERIAPLAARVVAGYSTRWDGNNNMGELTEDAEAAADEIASECQGGATGWDETQQCHVWDAADWLQGVSDRELGLTAQTTDDEIKALAERLESETEPGTCDRIDGAEEHLRERRDALREEEESAQ